jgi:hypothetical protein
VKFLSDGFEVVSRIEFSAKAAPCSLLDSAIDFAQALRRNAQRHYLPDAHHHVPGHDFDAGGWKRLVETLLPEFGIDLLERFRLIMLEKNGEQKCALWLGSLSTHKNSPLLEWLARKFVDTTNITSFGFSSLPLM